MTFEALLAFIRQLFAPKPQQVPIPAPIVAPEPVLTQIQPIVEYLWDTPTHARRSVRMIADEEGLNLEQKNTMCATIGAESGWKTWVVNRNKNTSGVVVSADYGICQWNDVYHGKEITPKEAIENPEKAVRLMCRYWRRGQRNLWIAYKNGSYKEYLYLD